MFYFVVGFFVVVLYSWRGLFCFSIFWVPISFAPGSLRFPIQLHCYYEFIRDEAMKFELVEQVSAALRFHSILMLDVKVKNSNYERVVRWMVWMLTSSLCQSFFNCFFSSLFKPDFILYVLFHYITYANLPRLPPISKLRHPL